MGESRKIGSPIGRPCQPPVRAGVSRRSSTERSKAVLSAAAAKQPERSGSKLNPYFWGSFHALDRRFDRSAAFTPGYRPARLRRFLRPRRVARGGGRGAAPRGTGGLRFARRAGYLLAPLRGADPAGGYASEFLFARERREEEDSRGTGGGLRA
jgi:hypothetical protein